MITNRQEGLITLHGLALAIVISGIFMIWGQVMDQIMWVQILPSFNRELYFLAIFVAMLLSIGVVGRWGEKIAALTFLESIKLAWSQWVRLALSVLAVAFAMKDSEVSRVFLGSFLGMAAFILVTGNYVFPRLLASWLFQPGTVRTLFIGRANQLAPFNAWISTKKELGVAGVGYVCHPRDSLGADPAPLGTLDQLSEVLEREQVSQVVVPLFYLTPEETRRVVAIAQDHGCRVRIYNNFEETHSHQVQIAQEGPYTFYSFDKEPLENPANRVMKRCLDIAVSLPVVLFLLPPLTIAVWFMQRRQSPGPVFFRQPRFGITKKPFLIFKYRTMHVASQSPDTQKIQAKKNDPRVFEFGRIMRKTSIDEIPQFLNVLLGDMSVNGPRPHLCAHDEEFAKIVSEYRSRHFVKPGITGLAQCNGYRGEITEIGLLEKRISYDLAYIKTWSVGLDLQIIFRTAWQVIFPPRSAY